MFIRNWRFMDEGNGGGAGGTANPPIETPAYFSQFKKENQERFKGLAEYKSLDELAEVALKGKEIAGDGNWIKKPTEDSSPDEIRAFLTKLGVPESKDDYSFPAEEDESALSASFRKVMQEQSFRNGLSDTQAQSMWGVFKALGDTVKKSEEERLKNLVDGFDSRYEKLFEESIPDKAKRESAITESMGHLSTFLSETGLAEAFRESGLLFDERAVKAIADYQKSKVGSFRSGGEPSKGKQSLYGKEFNDYCKER